MRAHHLLAVFLPVVAFAYWAYRENYETQKAIEEVEILQSRIGHARETLRWLSAEWAYQNRPERIAELADKYFDELRLVEVTAARFGDVKSVPFRDTAGIKFDYESALLIAAPVWVR